MSDNLRTDIIPRIHKYTVNDVEIEEVLVDSFSLDVPLIFIK